MEGELGYISDISYLYSHHSICARPYIHNAITHRNITDRENSWVGRGVSGVMGQVQNI